jgi:sarcosine oxidase gamma subunit
MFSRSAHALVCTAILPKRPEGLNKGFLLFEQTFGTILLLCGDPAKNALTKTVRTGRTGKLPPAPTESVGAVTTCAAAFAEEELMLVRQQQKSKLGALLACVLPSVPTYLSIIESDEYFYCYNISRIQSSEYLWLFIFLEESK